MSGSNAWDKVFAFGGPLVTLIAALVSLSAAYIAKEAASKANSIAEAANEISQRMQSTIETLGTTAIEQAKEANLTQTEMKSLASRQNRLVGQIENVFEKEVSIIDTAKDSLLQQTRLLEEERLAIAQREFQFALNNAEKWYNCGCLTCQPQPCRADFQIRVPVATAERLEKVIGTRLSGAEYLKFTLFGSAIWDADTLARYCRKALAATEQKNDLIELYLAHAMLGHAEFLRCSTTETNEAERQQCVASARKHFGEAVMMLEREQKRDIAIPYLSELYIHWIQHELCQRYGVEAKELAQRKKMLGRIFG